MNLHLNFQRISQILLIIIINISIDNKLIDNKHNNHYYSLQIRSSIVFFSDMDDYIFIYFYLISTCFSI